VSTRPIRRPDLNAQFTDGDAKTFNDKIALFNKDLAAYRKENDELDTVLKDRSATVAVYNSTVEKSNERVAARSAYQQALALDPRFSEARVALSIILAHTGDLVGARRIPMSTLGLLQYIAPSLQLLLGIWLYGEPFSGARVAGFVAIWSALAVYTLEGSWQVWSTKTT